MTDRKMEMLRNIVTLMQVAEQAADYLQEAHEEAEGHLNMRVHRREEPECSYCKVIKDVRLAVKKLAR